MLVYGLAVVVAIGSLLLYAIALRFPVLSQRSDVIWSGFGLFYALVLWVCGEQLTGAVLLSQGVVVGLLAWQGWQSLSLREQVVRSTVDPIEAAALPNFAGWSGVATLFRPSDPQLSGWTAFKQSIVGLGLLVVMRVRSQPWSWPWPPAGPIATPPTPPMPTPPAPTPDRPSPPIAPVPSAPTAGLPPEPPTDSESKPVYVRKKYRQPPDSEPGAGPVAAPPPAPPSPPATAGPGESKPVYVRKKYRQALGLDEAANPAVAPPPAPAPAPKPKPAPEARSPQRPPAEPPPTRSPRRPAPEATVKLDGANLPDEIVVDYEDVPPRSPRPRRRSES